MKIDKFDIGAEIISILTKGMYPDPRDAVREYIQNSIDAKAENVSIKVRQNSVVIEDDGIGMDYKTLRRAIRVGVSDKKPGEDVGFMGIGIYSSFHLCDSLMIFTKRKDKLPQYLEMDFKGMRELLKEQKIKRQADEISSEDLTDLQTLLEKFIKIPGEGEFPEEEYPVEESGTRLELIGLNPVLDDLLNNYDDLSNYLQDVVPLRFNRKEFEYAEVIETKLKEVIERHGERFELINLKLQVGTKSEDLFRPYTNDIFSNNKAQFPEFYEIKSGNVFLGIAWGCLNSDRERIILPKKDEKKRNLRGFIIKKQGFSIGTREVLSRFFGSSNTYYHRYTGEILIVNKDILPNASRNDLESSDLKKALMFVIQNKVAIYYTSLASKFQESDIARSVLEDQSGKFKSILGQYNPYDDNYNNYLEQISGLDSIISALTKKKNKISPDLKKDLELLKNSAEKLKREIALKFDEISKKPKRKTNKVDKATEIAKDVSALSIQPKKEIIFESIVALIESLDIDLEDNQKKLFEIIDDKVLKAFSNSKSEYYNILNDIKSEFENGSE